MTCHWPHWPPKRMAASAELPRNIRDALVSWDHAMEYEGPPDFTNAAMMYEKTYDLGELFPALTLPLSQRFLTPGYAQLQDTEETSRRSAACAVDELAS